MNIIKKLIPSSKYELKSPYTMTPEAITVHNTANDASAANEISYMTNNSSSTSFHYAVDDIEAIQAIPENRNAWHAGDGDGFGNLKTIGIEICYSKSGGDKFIQAEKNAAELIADILNRYNWDISKVGTHQMRSGKYCPHRTLDLGWERFLDLVRSKMEPQFVAMDNPRKMKLNVSSALVNIPSLTKVKIYAAGTEFDFASKVTVNGVLYLRTKYSTVNNIKTGIKFSSLSEIVVPVVEESPVAAPEPVSAPVEEKTTVDPSTAVEAPVEAVETSSSDEQVTKSWLLQLLSSIGEAIIKVINSFKKG